MFLCSFLLKIHWFISLFNECLISHVFVQSDKLESINILSTGCTRYLCTAAICCGCPSFLCQNPGPRLHSSKNAVNQFFLGHTHGLYSLESKERASRKLHPACEHFSIQRESLCEIWTCTGCIMRKNCVLEVFLCNVCTMKFN